MISSDSQTVDFLTILHKLVPNVAKSSLNHGFKAWAIPARHESQGLDSNIVRNIVVRVSISIRLAVLCNFHFGFHLMEAVP